jgi:tetratricopeptide (TPR) repeat protein
MKQLVRIIPVVLAFHVLSGCSTKKNTVVSRAYHNLTSRYNGYYYAEENIKESAAILENGTKDDYSKILPIFRYGDGAQSKAVYPQLEKAIKKSSRVIHMHSLFFKGKEYCKWIDNNYLVIGKANFYKQDYFAALETFDYVIKQYKRDPIRYDAMLWMVKTYNQQLSFANSESMLTYLEEDKKMPKNLDADFYQLYGDYYLKRENYGLAKGYLTKAISHTKSKKLRTRMMFILAQIHQREGESNQAVSYYRKVIKQNPSYEMTFNAKINLARSYEGKENKEIKKRLNKMIKDEKNVEYLDQIYFAMAEVYEKEPDEENMIKNLRLSISSSVENSNQKGISYLKLANHFFDKPQYKMAQMYYDSAVSFLAKDHPDYPEALIKKNNLTRLVKNLNIIAHEDSLQRLALLSEKEINERIEKAVTVKKEKETKTKENEKQETTTPVAQNKTVSPSKPSAQWYFYNPATVSFGFSEFKKKWGERKLEDNWRRSQKEMVIQNTEAIEEVEVEVEEEEEESQVQANLTDQEFFYKKIPFTAEQKEKSNAKIIEAYYNAGNVYREQLLNDEKAIETFEELLKRYPENIYKLPCYYQLYRLNLAIENEARAEYYKKIILGQYPESDYAKIILNPDFNKQKNLSKEEIEKYYIQTYESYNQGLFTDVLMRCDYSDATFKNNHLKPKFDYLKALSIGKTQSIEKFEEALKKVIAEHSKDEVKGAAQAILDLITKQKAEKTDTLKEASLYNYKAEAEHYFVIIVSSKGVNQNQLKNNISDFNSTNFAGLKLSINALIFDSLNQSIIVKAFVNDLKSKEYYQAITANANVLKSIDPNLYKCFVISSENYGVFSKDKKVGKYLEFYQKKYLL